MMFQQFTGINAIVFYAPVLFSSLGKGSTGSLENTCIIGAVNVLSTLVAVFLVDRVGRKALLIQGGLQVGAGFALVSWAFPSSAELKLSVVPVPAWLRLRAWCC